MRLLPTLSIGLVSLALAGSASSQSARPSPGSPDTLPPALRAAMLGGNARAVSQAITTLSAGNPQVASTLAAGVVAAAEKLLATNPQAAIQAASAAVETVRATSVGNSSPAQTENVITTAARIFVSPQALKADPAGTAQLALSTLGAASATRNAALISTVAGQVVGTAEASAATNPVAAAQLAQAAVTAAQSPAVTAASPAQASATASAAARVIAQPEVQRTSPTASADIAVIVVRIASTPSVYRMNPEASVQSMTSAYASANSPAVLASVPASATSITTALTEAKNNNPLGNLDTQIAQIMAIKPSAPPVPGSDTPSQPQPTDQTPVDVTIVSISS